jgi:hypothetical protein
MPLKLSEIKKALAGEGAFKNDRLYIVPYLSDGLDGQKNGNASFDLRV